MSCVDRGGLRKDCGMVGVGAESRGGKVDAHMRRKRAYAARSPSPAPTPPIFADTSRANERRNGARCGRPGGVRRPRRDETRCAQACAYAILTVSPTRYISREGAGATGGIVPLDLSNCRSHLAHARLEHSRPSVHEKGASGPAGWRGVARMGGSKSDDTSAPAEVMWSGCGRLGHSRYTGVRKLRLYPARAGAFGEKARGSSEAFEETARRCAVPRGKVISRQGRENRLLHPHPPYVPHIGWNRVDELLS
ncbi:hypothetical protein B0H10DRAFT_1953794 [Mycena sp. CBHHK59/15]|nr:hypothetical protein B0H10DRAFT_1953794 [Mycena sp. CBHHK59/15]